MGFFIKLAWRNLFRNKRRTIIAGSAIGLGLAALIFSDALIIGMRDSMIRSATDSFLGEGQIHRLGFRLSQDVEKTINRLDQVVAGLREDSAVDHFALRAISFGMVTSPANVSGVLVVGLEPDQERFLSKIDEAIREGAYFDGTSERDIVIGRELSGLLEVGLDDRVVLTVTQAQSGDLSQEMFRVSGIYQFDIQEMDTGMAFIRLPVARRMLGIGRGAHEIALKFKDSHFSQRENAPFWARYSAPGNEALSWTKLLPELNIVFGMAWVSMIILAAILFGIVAFGIINTLFMSLYERLFEFGVIRAIGTRPGGTRKLIIFEAASLAVLSIVIGSLLGLILTGLASHTGIDYRGIEFAQATITEIIYPVFHARQFIVYPLATFLFTVLMSLYPASVASRMSISKALRKSL